ncbi:hypothetical protein V501_03063 [Pseudogymnoascus sp. VKM F-4519 (FW-2642)]|nr:hypothetical protein V501_03063 [Pseudogymnoascus sp. VKM F-4519 (FW-2642)]
MVEHLNLLVKWGSYVTVSEAQSLWVIKRVLGNEVPVPELYGWRVDGRDVFIYMEYIKGEKLKDRWDSLTDADKTYICHHLRQILTSSRQVEQDPDDAFIESPSRQHLLDYVLEGRAGSGPFATIKQFNDWFSRLPWLPFPNHESFQDPWREFLPDTGGIKLTHGDLHRGNIIISPTGPPRVLAVVDWAHCGWYPDYWEY